MNKKSNNFKHLFLEENLKKQLTKKAYGQFLQAKKEGLQLDMAIANKIAKILLKWCKSLGVTQYKHYFFSLNGSTSGKVESFFVQTKHGNAKAAFCGKQLMQTEVDCSSFPNGNANNTCNAKGFARWDVGSPIFVKEDICGTKTLYIPATLCNKDGICLDENTCLNRSAKALDKQLTKFLHIMGMKNVKSVCCMVGCEQEYFLLDNLCCQTRQDLLLSSRALIGKLSLKNQHQVANYFASSPAKQEKFVQELCQRLLDVGIIVKAHHGEVAPHQQELVQMHMPATIAVSQNMYLMEIINEIAIKYGFKVLLHEKPFEDVNGSGKHNNISIATDSGLNLLDFNEVGLDVFLAIVSAFVSGIHKNYDLLCACVASLGNDARLGGKEAPTTIFSVFLGDELEKLIKLYFTNKHINELSFDIQNCQRNRTSPFAFTGNKFEFRMVGSSQNIAFANAVLQTILAEEFAIINQKLTKADDVQNILKQIIKSNFKQHKKIVFNGDSYTQQWKEEAKKRGINNFENSLDSIECLKLKKNIKLFERNQVLSAQELKIRYTTALENYANQVCVQASTLYNMLQKQILPYFHKTLFNQFNFATTLNLQKQQSLKQKMYLLKELNKSTNLLQQNLSQLKTFKDEKQVALGRWHSWEEHLLF